MLRSLILALGLMALAAPPAPARAEANDAAHPAAAAPHGATAADPAHGADDAAHGEGPNILEPQLPLAFWTLVTFTLLLLVLWRFAWGPLARALHDREHRMEHSVRQVEEARSEAERLMMEHRKLMEDANQRVAAILDEARRDAEVTSDRIRKAAQDEAASILDRARREIESARDQALVELWGRTAELAVSVAGKVLSRELHHDDHRRLIEVARSEMPAAPGGNGVA